MATHRKPARRDAVRDEALRAVNTSASPKVKVAVTDIGAYEVQPPIRLRIERVPPNQVAICWQAEDKERYELVCSDDITKPAQLWTSVTIITGQGGEWCERITLQPAPSQKFFLVRAVKR
jgi:hypothetical protein